MGYHLPAHSGSGDQAATPEAPKLFHVLVLDDEPAVRDVLDHVLASQQIQVHQAASLHAARRLAQQQPIDLAIVDLQLADGNGLELARQLSLRTPAVPSIIVAGKPSYNDLLQAMRAGACDCLAKPFDIDELNRCVERALRRRCDSRRLATRVQRLRRICHKLNQARIETTQQVDILCNDLVTAYHELAGRFKHVQVSSRFAAMIEPELALEPLLHQTLDFILQQLGPTNAAIFLPGHGEGYTTGGYVNYSFDKETASVILPQLAERVAPRIVEQEEELVHLTSDDAIRAWLEGETVNLDGSEAAMFPCNHEDETLAGVCVFRNADEPFDPEKLEALAGIGAILGRQFARIIRVHHRIEDIDADTDQSHPW